jgi:hypothetical protein
MEKLQSIINNNKGDITLYRIIFNVLSDNNTLKNYTNNSNGILFNMSSFKAEQIQHLFDNVNSYIENKKEIEKIDDTREKIMKELSKTIDTTYKTELKNMINSNKKNTLSTQIEIDTNLIEKNKEKEELKKQKNKRIAKSVKNYQKPVIYKGSYERINNVLSKSVRKTKNTAIEEDERLYDTEQESIAESEEIDNECEEIDNEGDDEKDSGSEVEENPDDEMKDLFGSDSD